MSNWAIKLQDKKTANKINGIFFPHAKGICMILIPRECQKEKFGINKVRLFQGYLELQNQNHLKEYWVKSPIFLHI